MFSRIRHGRHLEYCRSNNNVDYATVCKMPHIACSPHEAGACSGEPEKLRKCVGSVKVMWSRAYDYRAAHG